MKKNRLLNFLKGVACFGVIFAHARFPGLLGEIIVRVTIWSVPIFYMISGYYSYNENEEVVLKKIPKKLKHILNITIIAIIIYLLAAFLFKVLKNELREWLLKFISLKNILKVVLFSDFDFIFAPHLWFLPALIYCYLLLYIVIKKRKINLMYRLLPLLFFLRIVITCCPNYNWHYQENFFISAIPNFFLGYYIANNYKIVEKFSRNQILMMMLISFFLNIFAVFVNTKIDFFEIFAIILSIFLFIYALRNPDKYLSLTLEKIGVRYSLSIYVLHMLLVESASFVASILNISNLKLYSFLMPILVASFSLLIAVILEKILNYCENNLLVNKIRSI